MKKIITVLLVVLLLCACQNKGQKKTDASDRYLSIIDNIFTHNDFVSNSNYFDINAEVAKIDDGYRFYVTIDNPRNALYDVEALAVEEGVDYSKIMAANIGIFEDSEYCLIPNQTNPNRGFVEGVVISGVSTNPEVTLYVYVSFKNEDRSLTRYEYIKLNAAYQD